MGYTHYWRHTKRLTNDEWADTMKDLAEIVQTARREGLTIGDTLGETEMAGLQIDREKEHGAWVGFNGLGADSHETFMIWQNRRPLNDWQEPKNRGWDFCKTARKAYDVAVTACLIYLESIYPERFSVSSDGEANDWEAGLALAKRALPRLDNVLKIPAEILFDSTIQSYHFRGGKFALATKKDGTMCVVDDKRLAVTGRFETQEGMEWAAEWCRRTMEERQRKLPARCDDLARWEARKMRTFMECAPTFGYLTVDPVEH